MFHLFRIYVAANAFYVASVSLAAAARGRKQRWSPQAQWSPHAQSWAWSTKLAVQQHHAPAAACGQQECMARRGPVTTAPDGNRRDNFQAAGAGRPDALLTPDLRVLASPSK
jgi:hypothetical protein